jgi:chemotaxis response regulator CheB
MKMILLITDVGGPVALHTLLSEMPEHFACPIVILPSSDLGLMESSAAALKRTVALPIEIIQPDTPLMPGCVFFGALQTCYRPVLESGKLILEASRAIAGEMCFRKTIENFAGVFGNALTTIFLSGRGREDDIRSSCAVLEDNACRVVALHHSETVVFDMGRTVLEACASAVELTSAEIVSLVMASPHTVPTAGNSRSMSRP